MCNSESVIKFNNNNNNMTRLAIFTFYGRTLGLHDKASFLI